MTKNHIKAGVIGHPIGHSKSPLIHNYWIKKYGLHGSYEAFDIAPEDFEHKVRALFDEGYAGFNVTIPHKEAAQNICADLTREARTIGAVNTLYKSGSDIIGTNTDIFGFVENVKSAIENFGFSCNLQSGPALVLGAGGAAKAILAGLLAEGVSEIILTNRSRDKAEKLADMAPDVIRVADWDLRSDLVAEAHFLVNTTALGMQGKPPLDINLAGASEHLLVSDIVYAPLMTGLLQAAREQDLRIVTGIGMLLHQARPSFEKWFGLLPDLDEELERQILAA